MSILTAVTNNLTTATITTFDLNGLVFFVTEILPG